MHFSGSRARPGFLVCHLDTVRGRTLNNPLLSSLARWQLSTTATHTTWSPALSVSTDDNVFMWNCASRFPCYPRSYWKERVWDALQGTQSLPWPHKANSAPCSLAMCQQEGQLSFLMDILHISTGNAGPGLQQLLRILLQDPRDLLCSLCHPRRGWGRSEIPS